MSKRQFSKGFLASFSQVFPKQPIPDSDEIVDAPAYPDSAEVARLLREKTWDQVTPQILDQISTDLPLLTSKAFQYFIPAFLLSAYREPEEKNVEFLIYALDPSQTEMGHITGELNQWKTDRLMAFTPQQRDRIIAFLESQSDTRMNTDAIRCLNWWRL